MFDLQALESAFASVEDVGKGEKTFEINGSPITLRVMSPQEEVAVQRKASLILEGDNDAQKTYTALAYLDSFKIGSLAYAIIGIGGMDFRDQEFIPTGEKLANGKDVQIPRHEALLGMVGKWSRTMLNGVYQKYVELMSETERRAEKAIQFEPVDTGAEIERLEARIAELKQKAEEDAVKDKDLYRKQFQQVASLGADEVAKASDASDASEAPEAPEAPVRRTSVPTRATPPTRVPSPSQATYKPATRSTPDLTPQGDSFVGSENLESQVAAENARLIEVRRRRQQGQPVPAPESALGAVHEANRMRQQGDLDGVPVYQREQPEVLGATPEGPGAHLNVTPKGRGNPRFQGPKKSVR